MLTNETSAAAFIEFNGAAYVHGSQFGFTEGTGVFGKIMYNAKPDGDQFYWKTACEYGLMALICDELLLVSNRRRITQNEKDLFADACASLVNSRLDKFLHHVGTAARPIPKYEEYLAENVASEFENHGLLPRMVTQVLAQERNRLFAGNDDEDKCKGTVAHPMHTFVEWLDRLEHDKAVDPQSYKAAYEKRRQIVALHRIGLALLPTATWH